MAKKDKIHAKPALTEETLARIFDGVADGLSLRKSAENHGFKETAIHEHMRRHPERREEYARACEFRRYYFESRLADLMLHGHEVALDEVTGGTRLQAVRLEIDTLKWLLCKLMPHKYGDKQALEVTGKDGAPLLPRHTKEEMAEFAALLARARAATDSPAQ